MARNESIRVIFDINWFISFLITGRPTVFENILLDEEIVLITASLLEMEFERVINYPKHKRYFDKETALHFFRAIKERSIHIDSSTKVDVCRDPKDNYLLALAKDSAADFLITGDKDLLDLGQYEKTIVCTLATFTEKYYLPY